MTAIQSLLNKCQKVFNEYIRKRDLHGTDYFKCISCGQIKDKSQLHAGHYYNVGHYDGLRFDEDNCHGQCSHCNTFLHGNLIEYTKKLPERIGEDRFKLLEIKAGAYKRTGNKWSRFTVNFLITEFQQKIKDLN